MHGIAPFRRKLPCRLLSKRPPKGPAKSFWKRSLRKFLRIRLRLYVVEYLVLVVPERYPPLLVGDEVGGRYRDLPAPTRGVYHEGGHGVTRGVAPQFFHDINARRHRGSEVSGTDSEVALVEVVGSHPDLQEFVHELFYHGGLVVYGLQQHRLASEGEPGVCEHVAGPGYFRGYLFGVGEVDAHVKGVVFLEHTHELRVHPHGKRNGDPCTDSYNLHVRYLTELPDIVLERFGCQHERVPARYEDVSYGLLALYVFERL